LGASGRTGARQTHKEKPGICGMSGKKKFNRAVVGKGAPERRVTEKKLDVLSIVEASTTG